MLGVKLDGRVFARLQDGPADEARSYEVALTEYEHRDFSLVDVIRKGCSKGAALAELAAGLGIPASDVMAVGDNLNDLPMLEFAGTPVLMGNAIPDLRDRGWPVLQETSEFLLDWLVPHPETAELVSGGIDEYPGNYTYYLEERQERRVLQQAAYDNQQREIAEMERFVERFRAKATKAKQAQSRVKMLEKMERIPPPPTEAASVHFRFPAPRPSGRNVLELSTFSKTYRTDEGTVRVFDKAGVPKAAFGSSAGGGYFTATSGLADASMTATATTGGVQFSGCPWLRHGADGRAPIGTAAHSRYRMH